MSIFGGGSGGAGVPPLPSIPDQAEPPPGFGMYNQKPQSGTGTGIWGGAPTFLGMGDTANLFGPTSGRIGKTLLGT